MLGRSGNKAPAGLALARGVGSFAYRASGAAWVEKIRAELAVKSIRGVRAIANDIEVKSAAEMRKADESLAERTARLLTWYSSLRNMDVKAEVDDGHVTLTGSVDFLYQKTIVADRVAELEGATAVADRITIRRRRATRQRG